MDSILFQFGWIQIRWYSFLILLAVIIASFIIQKEAKKKGMSQDNLLDIIFYVMIIGILGARIYYVIFNLDYYGQYPLEIIKIWNGGLAIHGGLIASLIFLTIYTRKKNINLLLLLDIIVGGLILAQSIGRWGNFFNGEAYGREVTKQFLENLHIPNFIIKGMYIEGSYREPTFLYESILSLIGFIVLISIRKIKKVKTGMLTSIYLLWYGISRLMIESLRSDSLMLGPIKVAQLVSGISIICGIGLFFYSIKNQKDYEKDKLYLK